MRYNLSHVEVRHYGAVITGAIASQITGLTIVYSTFYSGADQRKHKSSTSLAFVWGIHRGPVNSPHKWPVTRKIFPFDDVIMVGHALQPQPCGNKAFIHLHFINFTDFCDKSCVSGPGNVVLVSYRGRDVIEYLPNWWYLKKKTASDELRKRWRATTWCGKSKFAISSGWLSNGSGCHPDDIKTLS